MAPCQGLPMSSGVLSDLPLQQVSSPTTPHSVPPAVVKPPSMIEPRQIPLQSPEQISGPPAATFNRGPCAALLPPQPPTPTTTVGPLRSSSPATFHTSNFTIEAQKVRDFVTLSYSSDDKPVMTFGHLSTPTPSSSPTYSPASPPRDLTFTLRRVRPPFPVVCSIFQNCLLRASAWPTPCPTTGPPIAYPANSGNRTTLHWPILVCSSVANTSPPVDITATLLLILFTITGSAGRLPSQQHVVTRLVQQPGWYVRAIPMRSVHNYTDTTSSRHRRTFRWSQIRCSSLPYILPSPHGDAADY